MSTPSLTITGDATRERTWLLHGLMGAALAAISNTVIYVTYLIIVGSPLRASMIAGAPTRVLTLRHLILAGVVPGVLATLFGMLLSRWSSEPRRWFLGIGLIVGLTSVIVPLNQPGAGGNQLVLALMYLVTTVAVVGSILPRVPTQRE
jgi:hypothetical protein